MNSTPADIAEPRRETDPAPPRRYVFADLAIRSAVNLTEFPILRGAPAAPLPQIRLLAQPGPAPGADQVLFRWPGGYGLSLGRTGDDWLLASARHGSVLVGDEGHSLWCFVDSRTGLAGLAELWHDGYSRGWRCCTEPSRCTPPP